MRALRYFLRRGGCQPVARTPRRHTGGRHDRRGLFVLGGVPSAQYQPCSGSWAAGRIRGAVGVPKDDGSAPNSWRIVDESVAQSGPRGASRIRSKAQAAARFRQDFPDLAGPAERLEANPVFPASVEVRPVAGAARNAGTAVDNLATALGGIGGVADVRTTVDGGSPECSRQRPARHRIVIVAVPCRGLRRSRRQRGCASRRLQGRTISRSWRSWRTHRIRARDRSWWRAFSREARARFSPFACLGPPSPRRGARFGQIAAENPGVGRDYHFCHCRVPRDCRRGHAPCCLGGFIVRARGTLTDAFILRWRHELQALTLRPSLS